MQNVLVVVDMQHDFIHGTLGTEEAKAVVDQTVHRIRNFEGTVYCTMDTHDVDYLDTQEGKNLPVSHCLRGSRGWMLEDTVAAAIEDVRGTILEKDTFGSLELCKHLAERNAQEPIKEIVLLGVCTDICVIANAMLLKTYFPETLVMVDAGCCAGTSPLSHQRALDAMKMCHIQILE